MGGGEACRDRGSASGGRVLIIMKDMPSALDVEAVEANAWAELQQSLAPEFRERLGIQVRRRDGATLLLASGTRELPINRAMGLGLRVPLLESELDAVIA